MADNLRITPRYIRNTDAFGWQGADGPDGPWRSITPPESGAPWQTTSSTDPLHQANVEVSGVEALSPTAQAVMIAATNGNTNVVNDPVYRQCIAAALRAVADQVVPETAKPSADSDYHLMNWSKSLDQYYQRQQTRAELLAIATELENHQ